MDNQFSLPKKFTLFKDLEDYLVLEHLKKLKATGFDLNQKIIEQEDKSSYKNHFHLVHPICCFHKYKSIEWLLKEGVNFNVKSGNNETGLTFFVDNLHPFQENKDNILRIFNLFKQHKLNFSQKGYDNRTGLNSLIKYSRVPIDQDIMDFLIENTHMNKRGVECTVLSSLQDYPLHFTQATVSKIVQKPEFDINFQEIETYEEPDTHEKKIYHDVSFASLLCFKKTKNFMSILPRIRQLETTHPINFNLKYSDHEDGNISCFFYCISERNFELFKYIFQYHRELFNDVENINGKKMNVTQYCCYKGFAKGLSFLFKHDLIDWTNKSELIELTKDPITLELLHKLHSIEMNRHFSKNISENINPSLKRHKI